MIKELLQFWLGMIFPKDQKTETELAPKESSDQRWTRQAYVIVGSVVILVFTGVIAYRLLTASFASIDFSQIISLILALFSIALSAQFYFKATDTSNKFYDRTYGLTKNLFEILARIEERFGEKLTHIHEDTAATRQDLMQSKNERHPSIAPTGAGTAKPTEATK